MNEQVVCASASSRVLVLGSGYADMTPERHVLAGPWAVCGLETTLDVPPEAFTVLPEPFAHIERLDVAAQQACHLVAVLAPRLREQLNQQLGVQLSQSFWDMALAPWLVTAVEVLVDRVHRLDALLAAFGTQAFDVPLWPADSTFRFMTSRDVTFYGVLDPDWNHWLFSRLLETRLPALWRGVAYAAPEGVQRRGAVLHEPFPLRVARRLVFALPFPRVKGFSLWQSLRLSLSLVLNRNRTDKTLSLASFDCAAPPLPLGVTEDELLALVQCMLPASLSTAHLPQSTPSTWVRTRVVSVAACDDDAYRLRLALLRAGGCRMLFIQHGGDYGYVRTSVSFPLVEYSQHTFLSWGWKKHGNLTGNITPLPHSQLAKLRNAHHEQQAKLVFVGTEMATLPYTLKSMLRTEQMFGYRQDKSAFLQGLPAHVLANTTYRPYFDVPSSLSDAPWLLSRFPKVPRCTGKLEDVILGCRLLVLDHLGTTFAQALAARIPVVVFWRPEWCHVTPQAAMLIEGLVQAGVVFYSPVAAAKHVVKVWDNVPGWWNSEPVCTACEAFAHNFALTIKGNEMPLWQRTLLTV